MSGHSHYATIKRQKQANDAVKGKIFSKLARSIQVAVRTGGSSDPASNYRLRMAIEAARAENMPKENIERAIKRAGGDAQNIEEVTYEGFGPGGISVIVEAVTDNRNRTSQEIKNLFERGGGSLGGPGSVLFNFEQKGMIVTEKGVNPEDTMLKLIDAGAEDVVEEKDAFEVYVSPSMTEEIKEKISEMGIGVKSASLVMRPKHLQTVSSKEEAQKILAWLEKIEEHDDVQKVYANLDVPQDVVESL
jgi:YebC/PmpR family DNA-binding regulatory protein